MEFLVLQLIRTIYLKKIHIQNIITLYVVCITLSVVCITLSVVCITLYVVFADCQ